MNKIPPGGMDAMIKMYADIGRTPDSKVVDRCEVEGHYYDFAEFLPPGQEAPAFTLPTVDGEPVSLADYRGRYLVLEFGAYT